MRTKIRLSAEESELVQNAEILLTKNRVIAKVMELFGELAGEMQELAEVFGMPPKISRGEQYQGLPYVILDYPRFFSKEDILAFRTMFWWGNYFIQTIHLRGKYLDNLAPELISKTELFRAAGFKVFDSKEEWHHDFEKGHFQPIENLGEEGILKIMEQNCFLKISVMIPLGDWEEAYEKFLFNYRLLLEIINSPGGGRGL